MRSIPGYNVGAVETEAQARVVWKRQVWDAVSVRVERTVGGPVLSGHADSVQASAEVVLWSPDLGVESDGLNLLSPGRAVPARNDPMDVYIGDDRGVLRMLVGRVKEVSVPSVADPTLTVTVGDLTSRFDYPITLNPLAERHPTYINGVPPVLPALHTAGIIDRIFRWRGFYATPARLTGTVLSVPLVGDAWPEVGTLITSNLNDPESGQTGPLHRAAPWGVSVHNVNNVYELTAPVTGTLYLTGLLASPASPSGGVVLSLLGDKGPLEVRFTGSSVRVEHGGVTVGTVPTGVASEDADLHWAVWIGDNGGVVVQIGESTQVVLGTLPAAAGATWNRLGVLTPARGGVQVAGIQVVPNAGTVSDRHMVTGGFTRTGIIQTSATYGRMLGLPAIISRNALDLLKEICQAEKSHFWVDEDGRACYRHRSRVFAGTPDQHLTADNTIDMGDNLPWQASKDAVTVLYRTPSARVQRWPTITLWSSSARLAPGDRLEEFIGPDADEDWARVDTQVSLLDYTSNGAQSLRNERLERGTRITGVVCGEEDDAGTPEGDWIAMGSTVSADVQQIVPDRWLVTARPLSRQSFEDYGLVSTQELSLHVPDPEDFPAGNASKAAAARGARTTWGTDGFVVRGKLRQTWVDQAATIGGGSTGGAEEHDAGHWVQTSADVADVGSLILRHQTDGGTVRDGVRVWPDVRRQVGDSLTLTLGGVTQTCQILTIQDEVTTDGWSQSLTLQTIGAMTDA